MRQHIRKLAFVVSLVGILLLLLISTTPPKEIKISGVNQKTSHATLTANVISQRNYSDFSIIKLNDSSGTIEATCFGCPNLETSKTYKVSGEVTTYKGNLQININKITQK